MAGQKGPCGEGAGGEGAACPDPSLMSTPPAQARTCESQTLTLCTMAARATPYVSPMAVAAEGREQGMGES